MKTLFKYRATSFTANSYAGQGVCSFCKEGLPEYQTQENGGKAVCLQCAIPKRGVWRLRMNNTDLYFSGLYTTPIMFSDCDNVDFIGRFSYREATKHCDALVQMGYSIEIV
jgi:hypothetical protein